MSLLNWIFDIYQHNPIDKAREEAAEARAEVARVRTSGGGIDSDRLVVAIEELALAVKSVQRTLIEKGVCSHEEFADLVRKIDREDGKADGRTPLL